jgi:hypothetical protein
MEVFPDIRTLGGFTPAAASYLTVTVCARSQASSAIRVRAGFVQLN